MSHKARTLKPVRSMPWNWESKNEYEEVSLRIQSFTHSHYRHKYDGKDHDIYDPRLTRMRSKDWSQFREPKRLWYTTYTENRRKMGDEVENALSYGKNLGLIGTIDKAWLDTLKAFYPALRHYEYGGSIQLKHVVRQALGSSTGQAATFTAADKMGRAQWISLWTIALQEHFGEDWLAAGKVQWESHPAFDKLLKNSETLFVIDDWAENLFVLLLCLDPLILGLAYEGLNEMAVQHGDVVTPILNKVSSGQVGWQVEWATAFFKMLADDPTTNRWEYLKSLGHDDDWQDYRWGVSLSDPRKTPDLDRDKTNREILQGWADYWIPAAFQAALELQAFFQGDCTIDVEAVLRRQLAEKVAPAFTKLGLQVPGV